MNHHRFFSPALLALIAAFALSACGFALRGSKGDFRLPFKILSVNISDNELFGATLKRQIQSTGTKVTTDRKLAEATLEILTRGRTKETLSLSAAGRTREYAIFYTFRFRVIDRKNNVLLDPVEIRLRRTMTYSESQAYAKAQEEEMLYQEMENDVILQVIHRLANIKVLKDPSADREPEL